MFETNSQNGGPPVFWIVVGGFAIVAAIVSSVLYLKTRSSGSGRRNTFLRNAVVVATAWIIVSLVRVFLFWRH